MRRLALAALAVLVLALTSCAGLPVSGPVEPGPNITAEPTTPDVSYRPDGPQPGATPQQIVEGFVRAASGPQDNWQTAHEFLATSYRDSWKPEEGVVVDVLGDRVYSISGDEISLQVTPVATVDSAGTYTRSDDDATAPLSYTLAQQSDGEWRITHAPNGIVLDEDLFGNVFRSYQVTYFDPTWEFLVPDVRWFPTTNAVTRIAAALVNGEPSPWLASSVASAFPDNVTLLPSVPQPGGVAQAQLSAQALGLDQLTLDRMQTQLAVSLQTAQVSGVEMQVDGSRISATKLTTRDTSVDTRALVLVPQGFGYLLSGELTTLPGLSAAIAEAEPTDIQLGAGRERAAVRLADGTAAVVVDDTVTVVDDRAGLLAPTIDPFDDVWTVPADLPGAVIATGSDGVAYPITTGWQGARIDEMAISRDGSRMAAVLVSGGRSTLVVAGVIRDVDGTPTGLGDSVALTTLPGDARDLAWLDATTLGVLAGGGEVPRYVQQNVGGVTSESEAPAGAQSLAGVNTAAAMRVLAADGTLFVRRQSNWVQTGSGIDVLATQQGDQE